MFYRVSDLAAICSTTEAIVTEAAIVSGKRVMAGMLTWHRPIPASFIEEVHRLDAMHRRAAQRRASR